MVAIARARPYQDTMKLPNSSDDWRQDGRYPAFLDSRAAEGGNLIMTETVVFRSTQTDFFELFDAQAH